LQGFSREECAGTEKDEFIGDYCLQNKVGITFEVLFVSLFKTSVDSFFSVIYSISFILNFIAIGGSHKAAVLHPQFVEQLPVP
jgi:hypothetical protein